MTALEGALPGAAGSSLWRARYEEQALRAAAEAPLDAARIYARALAATPDLGRVTVNLALLLRRAGREAEAEALLERAARLPEVAEVARRLRAASPPAGR
jgi:Tfp pilus assembly protein PilF